MAQLIIGKSQIPNALESIADDHVVAMADAVYDSGLTEYQDVLNRRVITDIDVVSGAVVVIESKIPEEASSANTLADKQFVIKTVYESASHFRGSFDTWATVPEDESGYLEFSGSTTPTLNDYIIIGNAKDYPASGKTLEGAWRFSYVGTWSETGKDGWKPEYQINELPQVKVTYVKTCELLKSGETPTYLCHQMVNANDTIADFPDLTMSEYVEGAVWQPDITNLRQISAFTTVEYVTPYFNEENCNPELLKAFYAFDVIKNSHYMHIDEASGITDEDIATMAKTLYYLETESGSVEKTTKYIYYQETSASTPVKVVNYNLMTEKGYILNKKKEEVEVPLSACCAYTETGEIVYFSNMKFGNVFYKLTSFDELEFLQGITKLSVDKEYRIFSNGSKIESLTLNDRMDEIGAKALSYCTSLTSLDGLNYISSLGEYSLSHCSALSAITFPTSITAISNYAFWACSGLESLSVDEGNPVYTSKDNCVMASGETLCVLGCVNSVIPETTTEIGTGAFDGCDRLTSITIPSAVTIIGEKAFADCDLLSEMDLPSSVTKLYNASFTDCQSLNKVTFSEGCNLTAINKQAFYLDSGLTTFNSNVIGECIIPSTVDIIGTSAFRDTRITEAVICATTLDTYSFANNPDLEIVHLSDNVKTISNGTFNSDSSLTELHLDRGIDKGITTLNSVNALEGCDSLEAIYVPDDSVQTYKEANRWSTYKDIIMGKGTVKVTFMVEGEVFTSTTIHIGSKVTKPSESEMPDIMGTFQYWMNGSAEFDFDTYVYEDITLTAKYMYNKIWYVTSSSTIITPYNTSVFGANYVASACTYDATKNRGELVFDNNVIQIGTNAFYNLSTIISITIPNSVTTIGVYAFGSCSSLTSITIPNSVINIGNGVFLYCTSLASVTIGNSVTSIGDGAFNSCTALTSVTIGDSVTSIGSNAFRSCTLLTSIVIPNSVTGIGDYAFIRCRALTSVTIGSGVTSIGVSAFSYCTSLASITIPNSVTTIGDSVFQDCTALTSVTIGDSVISIGIYAFYNCTSLASIAIPNNVTGICDGAFLYCRALTSVTVGSGVTSIGVSAFYSCSSLQYIDVAASACTGSSQMFYNTNDCDIYVPTGTKSWYVQQQYWSDYADRIQERS